VSLLTTYMASTFATTVVAMNVVEQQPTAGQDFLTKPLV
jgi:hypothetical protein